MINVPTICTFQSENAPESDRWMAVFYVTGRAVKGTAKLERLPICFTARTEEDVIAKADAFWAGEKAKETNRAATIAAMAAKRRAA